MKTYFRPAISLMNNLSYPKKLSLLALIFILPLSYFIYSTRVEINSQIQFAEKEKTGLAYVRKIMDLIQDMQQHRGMVNVYLNGDASFLDGINKKYKEVQRHAGEIDELGESVKAILKDTGQWRDIKRGIEELGAIPPQSRQREVFDKHTAIIEKSLTLVTQVADSFNLTLDPEETSYYLMDTMINKMPYLMEMEGQARGLGAGVAARGGFKGNEWSELIALCSLVEWHAKGVVQNMNKVFRSNADLSGKFKGDVVNTGADTDNFLKAFNEKLLAMNGAGISSAEYFDLGTKAINSGFELYNKLSPSLENELNERINRLSSRRHLIEASALFSFLILLYLSIGHFYSMVDALSGVMNASEKLAGGDLSGRVNIKTKDELSRIAASFNRMADALEGNFKELQASEAKNRALLYALPDSMLRINRAGAFLDCKTNEDSPFFQGTVVGKTVYDIIPEFSASLMENVMKALGEKNIQIMEFQSSKNGKTADFEARIVASGEEEATVIVRDITERKNIERMKDELISVVSHELRTPLTSIRGSLGLINGGVAGEISEQGKRLVDIAYKNSERLVNLINDILDIEKMESGKMEFRLEPIAVTKLLEQAVEANAGYAAEYGVALNLVHGGELGKISGDPGRLMQVFNNLISNAVKFSPKGDAVTLNVSETGDFIRISISDNGPGIPEEFQKKIFHKFAQADSSDSRQKGGTGLGLNICKMIVERLNGKIDFETTPGHGTIFHIDLPRLFEIKDEPLPAPKGAMLQRILICEDDYDVATLLRMILNHGGFGTDIAYTTKEAINLLNENHYDAMTLDLMLPDQDGISFLREIRNNEKFRNLPIIVVSVKAEAGKRELYGSAVLVADWISKPIDERRLIHAVKAATTVRSGDKPRILHIEDDDDVHEVVSEILKDLSETFVAKNLNAAKEKLLKNDYDLILLDLHLPDGNGVEFLDYLHKIHKQHIPVVVFSVDEVGNELAKKVAGTLIKSRSSNEQLLTTIQCVLRGGKE